MNDRKEWLEKTLNDLRVFFDSDIAGSRRVDYSCADGLNNTSDFSLGDEIVRVNKRLVKLEKRFEQFEDFFARNSQDIWKLLSDLLDKK